MNQLIKIACLSMILIACTDHSKTDSQKQKTESEYKLLLLDSYQFRRAYHGQEEMDGKELELFLTRNPEPSFDYENQNKSPFYSKLIEYNLIVDGNLNLSEMDPLPSGFEYRFSKNEIFTVEYTCLDYVKEFDSPAYALTFKKADTAVLVDTLVFGFPPDVIIFTMDLNHDGKQELLTLYTHYIVNGDSYTLDLYGLENRAQ